jgi:hypothetical protein
MTKRDYCLLAACVADARLEQKRDASDSYGVTIAENLADALELQNPRFDRARFLVACGFTLEALGSFGVRVEARA